MATVQRESVSASDRANARRDEEPRMKAGVDLMSQRREDDQRRAVSRRTALKRNQLSLRNGCLFRDKSPKSCNYHPIALRRACACTKCVHPSDRQKTYSSANIPTDIEVKEYRKNAEGGYQVTWINDVPGFDEHVSTFSTGQIRSWVFREERRSTVHYQQERLLWDKASFSIPESTVSYHSFMSDRQSQAKVLHNLWRTGLSFISDVPEEPSAVQEMAQRIGPLYNSFYGMSWDVRSSPDAKNVAYTNRYLGFHMDLLYMNDPPGIQLLHCLQNSCTGGESRFADTFKALDRILALPNGKDHMTSLQKGTVSYQYLNDGHCYRGRWPTVDIASQSAGGYIYKNAEHPGVISGIRNVYWSPPFEATEPTLRGFEEKRNTTARHHLAQALDAEASIVETKLPAGTCAIFDNLRVVHAREAFDVNSGHRWLRGAYVSKQAFLSMYSGVQDLLPKL